MASPDKIIMEGAQLLELIPQRPPMVMIDTLYSCEGNTTISGLLVREDNIFCEKGIFREAGLIENIAQTAAAWTGYAGFQKDPEGKVRTGFIGGIRDLSIFSLPVAGTRLTTTVTFTHEVFNASVILGKIEAEGELIASCEMKIFLATDEQTA
jgi:predicted hotdog family 3-hydroxylacyl-ACP dehydratase